MTLFDAKWNHRWDAGGRFCLGLDPKQDRMPDQYRNDRPYGLLKFCRARASSAAEYIAAFKSNLGYFLSQGSYGINQLEMLCKHFKHTYPDMPIILDCKSGDIAISAEQYAEFAFDMLGADAMTANAYLGDDSLEPLFKKYPDRTIFVLCRTSNPGAGKYQDLLTFKAGEPWSNARPLYQQVAWDAQEWNAKYSNCGVVVGATAPEELSFVRSIVGAMQILLPGIGTQGGDLDQAVKNGMNSSRRGLVINVGSSIIFASDPKSEAKKIHTDINRVLATL
ncbi:MAG TPA: orotidine-5'-phosphate decarboxylase [Candidatus Paceibacterota bacterium]|nr:orotidine-5'-phosphate decarboxylase [Candidatus Paceibacterota bacterium]